MYLNGEYFFAERKYVYPKNNIMMILPYILMHGSIILATTERASKGVSKTAGKANPCVTRGMFDQTRTLAAKWAGSLFYGSLSHLFKKVIEPYSVFFFNIFPVSSTSFYFLYLLILSFSPLMYQFFSSTL